MSNDDKIKALENEIRELKRQMQNIPARWGSVRMEGVLYGKLDGSMSPGGSATMSVWSLDAAGGLDADTGRNVTAYDPDLIPLDVTIASGSPCKVIKGAKGRWWLDGYRCTN